MHGFSATGVLGRLLAAALVSAGLFSLGPNAQAQGTLISPGGQPRVTAPGGLRGRAALKHRHKARPRTIRHRRHH